MRRLTHGVAGILGWAWRDEPVPPYATRAEFEAAQSRPIAPPVLNEFSTPDEIYDALEEFR